MIRYLTEGDQFWMARVVDDIVVVTHGEVGTEGEVEVVDTRETLGLPPAYALDDLASPYLEIGYAFAPIPKIETVIEEAHGMKLPEPVRSFFADGTYWKYQYAHCPGLGCEVEFDNDAVLGNYYQEHWDEDREVEREFLPISGVLYDGIPDEQQWIGIDPTDDTVRVYALYTSGSFDVAFDSFEAFLADLVIGEE